MLAEIYMHGAIGGDFNLNFEVASVKIIYTDLLTFSISCMVLPA